jgi:hypothetical protein
MRIMNLSAVLDRLVAELVCGAMDSPWLHTIIGHPNTKTERIVVTTIRSLCEGRPSKLPGPNDQRLFELAPSTTIF